MADNTALVVGASGVIGRGLIHALSEQPNWRARGLGRHALKDVETIAVDLTDRAAVLSALSRARDTTHLFYAALSPQPDLAREVLVNGAMLDNVLDGLKHAGAPLRRVVLFQGAKVYGVHLGPVLAPFYEDSPRHMPPNFYFTQEDALRRRGEAGEFDWSILRPDVVVGEAIGTPMNIAMVMGAFAALSRATGAPFRFPGSHKTYNGVLAQVTDARLLGRASLWAATADAACNQAFNFVHEPFRWERIWTTVGQALGLEIGPPMPMSLARHMTDKADLWDGLRRQHGLVDQPYDKLVGWGFGDFIFNCEFDVVSDMGKIRRAGFNETVESASAITAAIGRLREARALPP